MRLNNVLQQHILQTLSVFVRPNLDGNDVGVARPDLPKASDTYCDQRRDV